MTLEQQLVTILVVVLATMTTRFLPFMVFNKKRPVPKFILYLGHYLPSTVMALLVIYAFKSTIVGKDPHQVASILAAILTAAIHFYKRNMLLSIALGTISYMLLIQVL